MSHIYDKFIVLLPSESNIEDMEENKIFTKPIKNIYSEGELPKEVTCAKFAHTTRHGATNSTCQYF